MTALQPHRVRWILIPGCTLPWPKDNRAHVTQARDILNMHAPVFGLRGCLNFFGGVVPLVNSLLARLPVPITAVQVCPSLFFFVFFSSSSVPLK